MFTDYLSNPIKNHGQNISDVQVSNRKLILNLIQRHKVISRIMLAELSNLKPATITIIINEFIKNGIIEECGLIERENQRRVRGLRLIQNKFCTINVRITSSYYVVGIFDINSECITFEKIPYNTYENFSQTLVQISNKIEQFVILCGDLKILGISIGVHDNFLFTNHSCKYYESGPSAIRTIDIDSYFRVAFSYPIYIERSSDFVLYWLYHANKIHHAEGKVALYLAISTSIDLSFLYYGRIYQGAFSTANALKNIRIKGAASHQWENASDLLALDSVLNRAKKLFTQFPDSPLAQLQEFRYRDLINAYNSNDPLTIWLFTEVANEISQLLIILIDIFSPHLIVIGDELPLSDTFFDLLRKEVEKHLIRSNIPMVELMPIEKERSTKLDPVLRGGSAYIIECELSKIID